MADKALETICRTLAPYGHRDRDLERIAGEIVDDLRDEGFALTALSAQPAAEGWIDWPGLKQPVDDDTVIEFLADDGVIERRLARYMRWELPFEYRLPASPNAAPQDGGAGTHQCIHYPSHRCTCEPGRNLCLKPEDAAIYHGDIDGDSEI